MDWRNYFRHNSWRYAWLGVLMNANELADELEILSKQFDEAMDLIGEYELEVRQQRIKIKYLQEMAIIQKEKNDQIFKDYNKTIDKLTQQLTDEEISNIRDEFLSPKDCDIYTFARAILKKASEK
jgi:hypothetical protein